MKVEISKKEIGQIVLACFIAAYIGFITVLSTGPIDRFIWAFFVMLWAILYGQVSFKSES
jgi:hypothetical protein